MNTRPKRDVLITAETTFGEVRKALQAGSRPAEQWATLAFAMAEWLDLPDDVRLIPALEAAADTPTRIDDPASRARSREIAIAAGRNQNKPAPSGLA